MSKFSHTPFSFMRILMLAGLFCLLGLSSPRLQGQVLSVPDFALKGAKGDSLWLSSMMQDKKGALVVFTSNHCIYSKKYEDRIINLINAYKSDFAVLLINSNDPELSEYDTYASMEARAKEKSYPAPYLKDGDQKIARLFEAKKNPVAFVLVESAKLPKKEVVEGAPAPVPLKKYAILYTGKIDDNPLMGEAAKTFYVRTVLDEIKAGKYPEFQDMPETGCNIKGL